MLFCGDGPDGVDRLHRDSIDGISRAGSSSEMFKDVTEGKVVDTFKAMVEAMFKGAATAKGALSITPEKVIVTTPGADKKEL